MKLLSMITCASIGLFTPTLRAASTAAEIIAEYVKNESALKSRHVISENIAEISDTDAPGKKRFSKYVIESKTDGTHHEIRSLYWDLPRPDAPALDEKALTQNVLWDGAVGYEFHQIPGHPEANF